MSIVTIETFAWEASISQEPRGLSNCLGSVAVSVTKDTIEDLSVTISDVLVYNQGGK